MNDRRHLFRALIFAVCLGLTAATPCAEVWLTAPQICRGRAYGKEARAAAWEFDPDQRVALATADSRTLSTSVFPAEGSDFTVHLRVRLKEDAECRLTFGENTFDLTSSGTQTQLAVDKRTYTFADTSDDFRSWTLLTIRRRQGIMTTDVNGQRAFEADHSTQAIEKIELAATRGVIAVQNFSLTGQLKKRHR